jgi:hypothetical protein
MAAVGAEAGAVAGVEAWAAAGDFGAGVVDSIGVMPRMDTTPIMAIHLIDALLWSLRAEQGPGRND